MCWLVTIFSKFVWGWTFLPAWYKVWTNIYFAMKLQGHVWTSGVHVLDLRKSWSVMFVFCPGVQMRMRMLMQQRRKVAAARQAGARRAKGRRQWRHSRSRSPKNARRKRQAQWVDLLCCSACLWVVFGSLPIATQQTVQQAVSQGRQPASIRTSSAHVLLLPVSFSSCATFCTRVLLLPVNFSSCVEVGGNSVLTYLRMYCCC